MDQHGYKRNYERTKTHTHPGRMQRTPGSIGSAAFQKQVHQLIDKIQTQATGQLQDDAQDGGTVKTKKG